MTKCYELYCINCNQVVSHSFESALNANMKLVKNPKYCKCDDRKIQSRVIETDK